MMDGWGGYGHMQYWGGSTLGWIFNIIIWAVIILGLVGVIRWFIYPRETRRADKTPIDILKERYARGEIDKQEFEEKKRDLM